MFLAIFPSLAILVEQAQCFSAYMHCLAEVACIAQALRIKGGSPPSLVSVTP